MINSDEPAYPTPTFYDEHPVGIMPGLTKREYFAAIALQGLLAGEGKSGEIAAMLAVEAADALITKLNDSE